VAAAGQAESAAMVEEMTTASHMLATEVDALNRLLGQFEFGQGARASLGSFRPARSDSDRGGETADASQRLSEKSRNSA
ncbi:hypothetical protein, partial [Streptomyces sp. P17]|uniref:hypothetical protein n=1 Tax=Streptomyces sp. P17 TaxID=3074716 RepID=UPI0028F421EA